MDLLAAQILHLAIPWLVADRTLARLSMGADHVQMIFLHLQKAPLVQRERAHPTTILAGMCQANLAARLLDSAEVHVIRGGPTVSSSSARLVDPSPPFAVALGPIMRFLLLWLPRAVACPRAFADNVAVDVPPLVRVLPLLYGACIATHAGLQVGGCSPWCSRKLSPRRSPCYDPSLWQFWLRNEKLHTGCAQLFSV